jgi:hypothetical protein
MPTAVPQQATTDKERMKSHLHSHSKNLQQFLTSISNTL